MNMMAQPDEFEAPEEMADHEVKILEAANGICSRLSSLAQEQVSAKRPIELRWLEELRLYYGLYDETNIKNWEAAGRSTAFVKLTRNKTNAWEARLSDLLFPTDKRNWGIEPTPVPKLAQAAQRAVEEAKKQVAEANRAAEAGDDARAATIAEQANAFAQQGKQTEEEIAEARARADKMELVIEDQLVESNYQAECRVVIGDGCRIGTGILKGPLTSNRLRSEWRQGPGGWALAQIPDPMPEYVRVDPWHFFPDMSASKIGKAEFTFERSLPSKKDLRKYARKFGFNKDAVRRLLDNGPPQLGVDVANLRDLRQITEEGNPITNRYVMWEYHGPLECEDIIALLRAVGDDKAVEEYINNKDPLDEHNVIIHFIDNEVLKIAPEHPLDSGASLYSVWNFEEAETTMFGYGVPSASGDSQRMINGAWRMMSDNSALSVGPQIVVDKTAVQPQDGHYGLRALKVWLRTGTGMSQTPFEVFNIPNNQQQLAGIIELGKAFMDEETSLPTIAQGEQGTATTTSGGMSMLFNSANVVFRRVVKSFDDDLTAPTIRRGYDWNMQFHPDDDIKGDMQVQAHGSSVLLVREVTSQNLLNIVTNWTVHPVLGAYLKVHDTLQKTLESMMIRHGDVLYSEEEAMKRMKDAAPPPEQQPVDTSLDVAKIEADSRIKVAEMARDVKIMELSETSKISIEDIRAKLEKERITTASKERMKAADIGVERQRAAEARAAGQLETEAVGQGVG